jgi:hypothetical protein
MGAYKCTWTRKTRTPVTSTDADMSTLAQSLQEQIAYLRQEAEDWKKEALKWSRRLNLLPCPLCYYCIQG